MVGTLIGPAEEAVMAFVLAMMLHRPLPLVEAVYRTGGVDAVQVVESESWFHVRALRREPRGHTSYGLFQLDNEWHPQYRGNVDKHIAYGAALLGKFKRAARGNYALAVAYYNGGLRPGRYSIAWGKKVRARRDALMHRAILYLSRRGS